MKNGSKLFLEMCLAIGLAIAFGDCASTSVSIISDSSQPEIPFSDQRIPDKYDDSGRQIYYSHGTRAPEIPLEQQAMLLLHGGNYDVISINGIAVFPENLDSNDVGRQVIFLPPGPHNVRFSYSASEYIGNNSYSFRIPDGILAVEMVGGRTYYLAHSIQNVTNQSSRAVFENIIGFGGRYQATVGCVSRDNFNRGIKPERRERRYLEPYDPSTPVERLSFLEMEKGIEIVSFNGNPVRWGGVECSVTIGIPPGRHELRLTANGYNLIVEAMNWLPGHRYTITTAPERDYRYKSTGFLRVTDLTGGRRTTAKIIVEN
jgi:hypothetical protein